jgi:hypothetical protein
MFKIFFLSFLLSVLAYGAEESTISPIFNTSKLNKDIYQIKMSNSASNEVFLNKCAEIAIDNGYQYFSMVGSKTQNTYSLEIQNIDLNKKEISSTIKFFNKGSEPELSYEAKEVIKSFAQNPIQIVPTVEKTPVDQPIEKIKKKNRIFIGFNYNLASEIYSGELEYGTGGKKYNGSVSQDFDKGFGISAGYLFLDIKENLDLDVGAFYDFPKSIKNIKISLNGQSAADSINTTKISAYGIYGNAIYNFDKYYLFGGLNTHKPESSGGSSSKPSSGSTDSGLGYQIGYGYIADERIRLEIQYRHLQFSADSRADDNSYALTINNAKIEGLMLQLKFGF